MSADGFAGEARAPAAATLLLRRPREAEAAAAARLRAAPAPDLDQRLGGAEPDRLTHAVVAYLAAPGLLFLGGWATPWAALAAGLAGLGALALTPGRRRGAGWPLGPRLALLCGLLGLLWAAGTGAHHLLYSTVDWQIRDAVLRDLATYPWPVGYREATGEAWLLRAPLGFFLTAGLGGRALGLPAAQGLLWAWCGLGLGLVLAMLATLARAIDPARPRRAFAVLAATFVLFHGADLLPNLILDIQAGAGPLASWGRGGERWDRIFQYSGHVTALLWTPNHALPSWLLALLLVRHWRSEGFVRMAALPLAAAAFWSPVGTAGAAALTVPALLRRWGLAGALRRGLSAPPNWLAAAFALPLCLYLTAGASDVPHGLLVARHPPMEALGRWALFLAVEVLPWAGLAALLLRRGAGWLLRAAVVLLCLLPLYVFGPGDEMTSHGGMAALAVLAVVGGAALLAPWPPERGGARAAWIALRVLALAAAIGSATEASLLVTRPAWPASRACAVPEAAHQSVFDDSTDWSHYLTPWPEAVLRPWLRPPVLRPLPPPEEAPRCWPAGRA